MEMLQILIWASCWLTTKSNTCNTGCGGLGKCDEKGVCTEGCKAGYFGTYCQNDCVAYCGGTRSKCDRWTGHCSEGCDPGFYGDMCLSVCSMNCAGNGSCNTVGHCDDGCKAGYTEFTCTDVCSKSTFGKNCQYQCGCKDNLQCDLVTGFCPNYLCADGQTSLKCYKVLPKLLRPPRILYKKCMNITLFWRPFQENVDLGKGPVGQYNVWSRPIDRSAWDNPLNVTDSTRKWYTVSVTTGLVRDKAHVFRVDVILLDNGVLIPNPVPGKSSVETLNDCFGNCTRNRFGPHCKIDCHCAQDEDCDKYNGSCPDGKCHPDWYGLSCERRLPMLSLPPRFVSVCMNITVSWDAFNSFLDVGEGPVGRYRVYMKQSVPIEDRDWVSVTYTRHVPGLEVYQVSITQGIVPNYEYIFRVDVEGTENGVLINKTTSGLESQPVLNECQACPDVRFGKDCQYTCHCLQDKACNSETGACHGGECHPEWYGPSCQRRLPMLVSPPRLIYENCMYVTLTWTAFNETSNVGQGPVGQYNIFYRPKLKVNVATWTNVLNVTSTEETVVYSVHIANQIFPNIIYSFKIDVVGTEDGKLIPKTISGHESSCILNKCTTWTTMNDLSSVGKKFLFVVAQTRLQDVPQQTRGFLFLYTPGTEEALVSATTLRRTENKSTTQVIQLKPQEVIFMEIRNISVEIGQNTSWRDLIFILSSQSDFGSTLVLEKNSLHLASLTILPVEYWGKTYVCFGINYQVEYLEQCAAQHGSQHPYTGVSLSGKHPFGVITVDSLNRYEDFCEDVENFISQDMPLPMVAFGTEFITIHSNSSSYDAIIVVQALHALTQVTLYTESETHNVPNKTYLIKEHLQAITIEPHSYEAPLKGARRLSSTLPVQVIYVLRPPCPWKSYKMGDLSYTLLVPENLFYNDYYIGVPSSLNVNVSALIVIPDKGRQSLSVNGQSVKGMWESVVAKPDWFFIEERLTETFSRIQSQQLCGCYAFALGPLKGYIHAAGYKSVSDGHSF